MKPLFFLIFLCFAMPIFGEHYFLGVLGTGRCGTKYISQVICRLGLDCLHEELGKDGIVSLYLLAKKQPFSFHEPLGHPTGKDLTFTHLFHQVRHPLKVISSFNLHFRNADKFWTFMVNEIDEIAENDPIIVKAAKYWYYWNLRADEIADWTYKIEEIDLVFEEFCNRLSIPADREALRTSKRTNNWGRVNTITWSQLQQLLSEKGESKLFENIRQLSIKYGYTA